MIWTFLFEVWYFKTRNKWYLGSDTVDYSCPGPVQKEMYQIAWLWQRRHHVRSIHWYINCTDRRALPRAQMGFCFYSRLVVVLLLKAIRTQKVTERTSLTQARYAGRESSTHVVNGSNGQKNCWRQKIVGRRVKSPENWSVRPTHCR